MFSSAVGSWEVVEGGSEAAVEGSWEVVEGGSEAAVGCGCGLITCIPELTATRGWGGGHQTERIWCPNEHNSRRISGLYI